MKNTEYNYSALSSVISSEDSLETLIGMIDDLGLELVSVMKAC